MFEGVKISGMEDTRTIWSALGESCGARVARFASFEFCIDLVHFEMCFLIFGFGEGKEIRRMTSVVSGPPIQELEFRKLHDCDTMSEF